MAKKTKQDKEVEEAILKIGVTEARAKEIAKELPAIFKDAKQTQTVIGRICGHKKLNEAEKVVLAFMAGTCETRFYNEAQEAQKQGNRSMYG